MPKERPTSSDTALTADRNKKGTVVDTLVPKAKANVHELVNKKIEAPPDSNWRRWRF
jgi:hypothetical protein